MKKILFFILISIIGVTGTQAMTTTDFESEVQNLNIEQTKKLNRDFQNVYSKWYSSYPDLLDTLQKVIKKRIFYLENIVTPEILEYEVISVVDGDTIKILKNNKIVTIRMIGIDAPESTTLRYGYTEPYGKESTMKLKELINNNTVRIETDESQGLYDKYDRLLAYVWVGNTNIGKEMIRLGYAQEYTYDKPYKYQSEFKSAQREAMKNVSGLWSITEESSSKNDDNDENYNNYENIDPIITPQNNTNDTSSNIQIDNSGSYEGNGLIKGNISSDGRKLYHFPGCPSYKQTKISPHKGERYFNTKEEAEAAGWVMAGNC